MHTPTEHVTAGDARVPAIGLGTWRLWDEDCRQAVETALKLGYRHIDTADHYNNHAAVGSALSASAVDREEVFLTTKVAGDDLEYDAVRESVERSLTALGTDYIDLLLIHWPNPQVPIDETMAAMSDLHHDGLIRHVGVSQFSVPRLREALDATAVPIVLNQLEYHPYYRQHRFKLEQVNTGIDLYDFCARNEIAITAYSPLGTGTVLTNRTIEEIANRHGKTPAQVVLRWHLQEGRCAIPKASTRAHLRDNIDVFDFELTEEEMATVSSLQGPLSYRLLRENGPVDRTQRHTRNISKRVYTQGRSRLAALIG